MNYSEKETLNVFHHLGEATREWKLYQFVFCIFLSSIALATIIGNCIVLYVFAKSRRVLRSPTHLLLANLALADLLVGLLVMPLLVSVTVFNWKWFWGAFSCQAADYVHFCLCATSMLSMVCVCLERYVGVRYPLQHNRILSTKRVSRLIVGIWILALVLTATPLSMWPVQGTQSPFTCQIPNLRPDFIFFISISLYWIPISATIFIYWLIYRTVTTPSSELIKWAKKSSLGSRDKLGALDRKSYKTEEEKFERARRNEMRLVKTTSILVSIMLVLYGPLFFVFLLKSYDITWLSQDILLTVGWIRYANSFLNPFLYVYTVPYYKIQLSRIFCKAPSSNPKNSLDSSTLPHLSTESSSWNPSVTNSEAMLAGTNCDLHEASKSNLYCTFCGNFLYENSKCKICGKDVPYYVSLVPPEEWGTAKHFNCPVCMNIRFFNGTNPCFCQICNHKFQPSLPKPDEISFQVESTRNALSGNCSLEFHTISDTDKTGSGLLSLTQEVESIKNGELKLLDVASSTVITERMRRSLIIPLIERRSRMLKSTVQSSDLDWENVKELDEIIAKLELDIDELSKTNIKNDTK